MLRTISGALYPPAQLELGGESKPLFLLALAAGCGVFLRLHLEELRHIAEFVIPAFQQLADR